MKKHTKEIMSSDIINEMIGEIKYTLSKSTVNGRKSFSVSVYQVTPSGDINYKKAEDISCDEKFATDIFRTLTEGEVEPCILHDVLYNLLP